MPSDWGINMIVHGPSKSGKSWLGDTTPAPRLVLDAEAGSRFTPSKKIRWDPVSQSPPEPDGSWETALVAVRDFRTVQKSFEWLNAGVTPFKSVVIDSISEVQQRCVDDISGTNQMAQQDWGQLLRIVSDTLRKFRDLTTHPVTPMDAVVVIAMSRQRDGNWEPYVQGQLSVTMPYYFDLCTYLAPVANPETGEIVRRLFIGTFPGFVTGERVGGSLGTYIDNPNVSGMLTTIREYLKR